MPINTYKTIGRLPRVIILLSLLFVSGLGVWYLTGRVYFVIEFHGPGTSAIWHDDEAFIFLGKSMSAKVARRYQVVLQAVIGAFWYDVPVEKFHQDLMVLHINGDKIEKYCLEDFGSGGGAFPCGGKLYFSRGGNSKDWPYVWRWSGTNFVRVPRNEALSIFDQFPPLGPLAHSVTEQIKHEGWKEQPSLSFADDKEMPCTMELKSRSLTIVTFRSESRSGETVLLKGRSGVHFTETLSQIVTGVRYRQITRREYLNLKNR